MNVLGELIFLGREWLPVAVGVGGVVSALALGVAVRGRVPVWSTLLKLSGVGLLALCLVEPSWTGVWAKPGSNAVALVADDSLSMGLLDRGVDESRGEQVRRVLGAPAAGWQGALSRSFDLQRAVVQGGLQSVQDFQGLTFSGRTSELGGALRRLAEGRRALPLAGILLFTDGQASDVEAVEGLEGLPPVYPVLIGGVGPVRDLAVGVPAVSQTAFEDAPVTVQAEIRAEGFGGEEIVARLIPAGSSVGGETASPAGAPLAEESLKVPESGGRLQCRFEVRVPEAGVSFYRLRVEPKAVGEAEATLLNNEVLVCVDRRSGPHHVLYLSGRPNWEYKFLRRALEGDVENRMVGLVRIAKREPKFTYRGRAGEASNPLFRGFGGQPGEDAGRYDQPVMVRLNAENEAELRDGFPKTAEELFKYRAVILDDLEAEFFTREQMTLLQRYVGERGGSLMVLGGMESFLEGQYARTPLGDLLPVYLEGTRGPVPAGPLRMELTREGWLQPWARLRPKESEERARMAAVPAFEVLNQVGGTKPGATVVASVTDGTTLYPALVAQRFGRGKTAALLVGDLWQSGLGDEKRQADLGRAWRQLVRWLVVDVPQALEVSVDPGREGGVTLHARVRDRAFLPVDDARVVFKVVSGQETWSLPGEASSEEAGLFEANFVPRRSGGYRVEVEARDDVKGEVQRAVAGWATNLGVAEFGALKPNRALMEGLARKTGGRVVTPSDLPRIAEELPLRPAPVTEPWVKPLWHTPWILGVALACFVADWGLRRRRGLP
jgi:uncharacterized membrane protein